MKEPRRFAIAISYAGEQRLHVRPVADILAKRFGRQRVLYDEFHRAEFARPNLNVHLPNLYRTQSELVVVVLSPDCPRKKLCGLELRFIREQIETQPNRVMPVSVGDPGDLSHPGSEAPQRPVEQVSWDQVQEFLAQLEGQLPGAGAVLPTEAVWEYACRAGTETPFSFGANVTPEQVNYDGNYPYAGGKKGQYRRTTVPVRSLPANAWGLHEMHGNVWEWCADGLRTYRDRSETDPRGEEGEGVALRVVRGGSWLISARRTRSAYRGRGERGDRYGGLGFRFALRSQEPGQAMPPLEGA